MSCLFNSLNAFIHEGPQEIRQKICNYLQENKPIIEGLDTSFVLGLENSDYINNMRSPSTWGGAIEIQVACNLWHIRINVKNYRDEGMKNIEFLPLNGQIERTINLYWTGGHYEPTTF